MRTRSGVTVSTGSSTDGQGSSVMDRILAQEPTRRVVAVDPLLVRRGPGRLELSAGLAPGSRCSSSVQLGPGRRRRRSRVLRRRLLRRTAVVVAFAGRHHHWLELWVARSPTSRCSYRVGSVLRQTVACSTPGRGPPRSPGTNPEFRRVKDLITCMWVWRSGSRRRRARTAKRCCGTRTTSGPAGSSRRCR